MRQNSGFTLVELLITVAIVGVLASVGVTAFGRYTMKAKSSEIYPTMSTMYCSVNAYWHNPTAAQGIQAGSKHRCVIGGSPVAGLPNADEDFSNLTNPPLPPTDQKRRVTNVSNYAKLVGFEPGGWYYCAYHFGVPGMGVCEDTDSPPNGFGDCNCPDDLMYRITAVCDLDGDGEWGGLVTHIVSIDGQLSRVMGYQSSGLPGFVQGID